VRSFSIDITSRVGVAANVVAPPGAIEELCLERAFQSLGRHFYFDRGGVSGRKKKRRGEEQTEKQSVHGALSIKAGVLFVPMDLTSVAATLSSS
jgi:hypothetical protein